MTEKMGPKTRAVPTVGPKSVGQNGWLRRIFVCLFFRSNHNPHPPAFFRSLAGLGNTQTSTVPCINGSPRFLGQERHATSTPRTNGVRYAPCDGHESMLAEKSPSETNRGEHSLCDIFVANDPTEHIPERKVANARTTGTTTTRFWCRALRASGGAGRGGGGATYLTI